MPIDLHFDHVGISLMATNLDRLVDWYVDKLDFAVAQRWSHGDMRFALLQRGDIRVECLGLARAPGDEPMRDIASSHTTERLHHLCVATPDLDAALAELARRDVHPTDPIMENAAIGQRFTFITDPLGTVIELTEPGERAA